MDSTAAKKPSVIVLCTGNSARSHLGEALLRRGGGDKIDVYSAGSHPSGKINPLAIQVMKEEGYDMEAHGHRSKPLSEFEDASIDVLITVCGNADQACPIFKTQKARYHWGFDDPSYIEGTEEEKLIAFRRFLNCSFLCLIQYVLLYSLHCSIKDSGPYEAFV